MIPARRAIVLALAAALAAPAAAAAHGLTGRATDLTTIEYVPLGIEHMLLGWDHLLFVLGIVLVAGRPDRAAKLVSLFVAGHSATLIAATLAEWRVSPTAVDVVIALSLVFVAALGLRGRPADWTLPGVAILVFGLIHGLGLSTRLQDLGIPHEGLLGKTIAFNVGIEIGQLSAVAVMVALVWLLGRRAPRWPALRRGAYALIGAAGAVAAVVLAAAGDGGDRPPAAIGSCRSFEPRTLLSASGGHPDKRFYGPGETAPEDDFGHVLLDGYVVVRYRPDLPAAQLDELRSYVTGEDRAVVAGPDPGQTEPVTATAARSAVACRRYDLPALRRFADTWFAAARAG